MSMTIPLWNILPEIVLLVTTSQGVIVGAKYFSLVNFVVIGGYTWRMKMYLICKIHRPLIMRVLEMEPYGCYIHGMIGMTWQLVPQQKKAFIYGAHAHYFKSWFNRTLCNVWDKQLIEDLVFYIWGQPNSSDTSDTFPCRVFLFMNHMAELEAILENINPKQNLIF